MLVEQSAPIPFKDEIPDPGALDMWLEVDGHRYQDGNTRTMIFDVKTIVSYVSRHMTLMPGDVIPTGTPPGMGRRPEAPGVPEAGQRHAHRLVRGAIHIIQAQRQERGTPASPAARSSKDA